MSEAETLFGQEHVQRYRETGGEVGHRYLNLEKDPKVELQVLDEVFPARARTAEGEERERLWQLVNQQWPDYDSYQTKTDREIPVVVLERASG